jgi:preprotein translocase subunit YajC
VLTSGGIIGVISYINEKDNEVTLRLEEGKVKVLKTAIVQILQASEGPKETAQEGGSK